MSIIKKTKNNKERKKIDRTQYKGKNKDKKT